MNDQKIVQHVEATLIRWMCSCGGEFHHLGQAFKIVNASPLLQPRGYASMVYPHQCNKCMVIADNGLRYPHLAARQ